ncbi:MAG: hypothetical protein LBS51_01255 [Oscillospiraceae bacterium]|nr:hypothetical protein [Oscillospiraceae bacterium]
MNVELTEKEYRRLLDMVYIGNWVLNSMRGDDRIDDYDEVEGRIFSYCFSHAPALVELDDDAPVPSDAFIDGGIHEAIAAYEDTVFFEILAEELARKDMEIQEIGPDNVDELACRIDEYIEEFEENGMNNVSLNI